LLISEPAKGTPSTLLRVLKQRVSRDLRRRKRGARTRQLCLPFAENGEDAKRFWQPRFYDFNVFTEKKKREKLEYMHANPVTRRLVRNPKDWPWSSFSGYAKSGNVLIPIDTM
jgi:putative transposase